MLTRQDSLQTFQNPQNQKQAQNSCFCLALAPAIAAVVIASQYNEDSPCALDEYTIDLQLFLNIAGYLTIAWAGVVICCECVMIAIDSTEGKLKANQCLSFPACMFLLFNLAWAGVGLYMYEEEMSPNCQEESIAIMILAWSCIQYCAIGLALCCMVCMCCCVAMTMKDDM
eukprot:375926_1